MPVSDIVFQGINRAASDYSNAGACEELINLRPTGTGLVPVKPFSVKMSNVTYEKVYVHNTSRGKNYIGVSIYTPGISAPCLLFWLLDDAGARIGPSPILVIQRPASAYEIYFASAGNYVLFSIKDDEYASCSNHALLWDGTQYKETEANIPAIDIVPEFTTPESLISPVVPTWGGDASDGEIKEQISAGLHAIETENKDYCLGPIIVALAFKTTDGNTFWTNKWLICDPFPVPSSGSVPSEGEFPDAYAIDRNTSMSQLFPTFFDTHEYGLFVADASTSPDVIRVAGRKLKLHLTMDDTFEWNANTSLLRSVEIYASRPALHVDPLNAWGEAGTYNRNVILPQVQYEKMGLGDQLLYLQRSILLKELANGTMTVNLEFGGNIQTTKKTLGVDAGATTRYGELLAYNTRFHFFNSVSKTEIHMPSFSLEHGSGAPYTYYVLVKYDNNNQDEILYLGMKHLPLIQQIKTIIAPSLNVTQVLLFRPEQTQQTQPNLWVYNMSKSSTYNYSIWVDGDIMIGDRISTTVGEIPDAIRLGRNYVISEEPSAINVTEQYNPFVFKVEHSYLAPGKILDVQPQMVAVKDVSFGDYPLNVLTDRGVYALMQGDGTTLYGNFRSISNLITTSNSVPTENGTFFIAAGNLWMVSGDNAVLVSDALNPGPHKFIRDSEGYRAISAGTYDVSELVSQVPFDKYVNGATLSYNRYRDELFVSNPEYDYTYVLSLKYHQWFKMSLTLSQDVVGSDIATVPLGTSKNIVDFTEELETVEDTPVSVLVHYQTRPFSIGYQYIHVHRLLSMIRANLSTDDLLIVGLYGSDNLQDWNLLSYASRSGIKISQIRTPSAARSWRYYTVCIGGNVPADTDFGPIMIDYQPVIRRIG